MKIQQSETFYTKRIGRGAGVIIIGDKRILKRRVLMDRDLGVLNDNRECSRKLGESLRV